MDLNARFPTARIRGADLVLPLIGGSAVGTALIANANAAGVLAGAMAGLSLILIIAWKWPLRALHACTGAILLGGMKFRMRSAAAVLEGSVDTQILFELAVYGAIGVAACTAAVALRLHQRRMRRVEWVLLAYAAWSVASVGWSRSPRYPAFVPCSLSCSPSSCWHSREPIFPGESYEALPRHTPRS